jgi:bifunctional DNA-binding transcriptional regulator/antitoxin component of YhaV-PrlF toxin-antitoxin module
MKEFTATVTQQHQVTLPVEVQRALGIMAQSTVIFAIEENQVRLLPATFTLESAAGSVSALKGDGELEDRIREAKEGRMTQKWGIKGDR